MELPERNVWSLHQDQVCQSAEPQLHMIHQITSKNKTNTQDIRTENEVTAKLANFQNSTYGTGKQLNSLVSATPYSNWSNTRYKNSSLTATHCPRCSSNKLYVINAPAKLTINASSNVQVPNYPWTLVQILQQHLNYKSVRISYFRASPNTSYSRTQYNKNSTFSGTTPG